MWRHIYGKLVLVFRAAPRHSHCSLAKVLQESNRGLLPLTAVSIQTVRMWPKNKSPLFCLMSDEARKTENGVKRLKKMSGMQFDSEAASVWPQAGGCDWQPTVAACVYLLVRSAEVRVPCVNVGINTVSGWVSPPVLSSPKHNQLRPSFRDMLKEWGHVWGETHLLERDDPLSELKIFCLTQKVLSQTKNALPEKSKEER